MASLPYETATSGDKALTEVQRILGKFGCQSFGVMTDAEKGKTVRLCRFMCEVLAADSFDPSLEACHSCHNRRCINPWHLRQDTHAANLKESAEAKRLNGQYKTHCKRGHPLIEGNMLKGMGRYCAICSRGRYRLRLGWPEHMAFSDIVLDPGFMLDRETHEVVPIEQWKSKKCLPQN